MEDIVAVEVLTVTERHYFLTWGRAFDPSGDRLLEVLGAQLAQFGVHGDAATSRVCASLQEAAQAPYFFEGLVDFCRQPVPHGAGYDEWRAKMRSEMESGHGIYYLGVLR